MSAAHVITIVERRH